MTAADLCGDPKGSPPSRPDGCCGWACWRKADITESASPAKQACSRRSSRTECLQMGLTSVYLNNNSADGQTVKATHHFPLPRNFLLCVFPDLKGFSDGILCLHPRWIHLLGSLMFPQMCWHLLTLSLLTCISLYCICSVSSVDVRNVINKMQLIANY